MSRTTRAQSKRKREAKIKDWRWLLWDSDVARDKIHPDLGAGWTAVLKEACCVKAGKDKDKVERLRKDDDEKASARGKRTTLKLKLFNVVETPTVSMLEWCVARDYEPSAMTFEMELRPDG